MKQLASCINGCDAPIEPPSKVLCAACMDRVTAAIQREIDRLSGKEVMPDATR